MRLIIDMTDSVPIYQQIRDQIVHGIANASLAPDEALPTVRQLAFDLGVNPMTVNKAYALLKDEGAIVIDRRQGAKVRSAAKKPTVFSADFDQRLSLLLAEARMHGASDDKILDHVRTLLAKRPNEAGHKNAD